MLPFIIKCLENIENNTTLNFNEIIQIYAFVKKTYIPFT